MKNLTEMPMEHALEVYRDESCIFYSDKNWLYPLLDFKAFLDERHIDVQNLLVKDAIMGRAAALLLVYLGIRRVFTPTLSKHGQEVLEHFNLEYSYQNLVPEIGCQTEQLLQGVWKPEEAYRLIMERIATQKKENS